MTMPERLEQQLKLGHAVIGLAIALAAPGIGVYVSFRLVTADVARHEARINAVEQRVTVVETTALKAQGETNVQLGRIDERLKTLATLLERDRR